MDLLSLNKEIRDPDNGIIIFAEKILGLPIGKHEGQVRWIKNSKKRINILRPGNKWGKSAIAAVRHLYHAFTKINLEGMYGTVEQWQKLKYDTLNFGPGYEQAREILMMARDIAEGNIFIPPAFQDQYGVTNQSMLKGWFITADHSEDESLPYITFASGVNLFGRSYSDMGKAFKMKSIAYMSGDEVGDIAELWTFTNGTLLPRGVAFKNFQIDYYGTPQQEGTDYMAMIEMAEEDMERENWEEEGMFYVQKGKMWENPFLDKETVASLMKISDPVLRQQVVEGEYVQAGEKYFGFERVWNMVDDKMEMISKGKPGRKYLLICDFAGGESKWADYSVFGVLDYTDEQHKLVNVRRFKGAEVPIPIQYQVVEEMFRAFKYDSDSKMIASVKIIIDSSALGGKNALSFLKHLNPIQYEFTSHLKGEMLAALKISLDGGTSENFKRKRRELPNGEIVDENPNWGLVRIPNLPYFIKELTNYKLDDKKIRTDCVMVLAMGEHYLSLRVPKAPKNRMVDFDILQWGQR